MKIDSTSGKGNFKIYKDQKPLLELKYKHWFSSEAYTHYKNIDIQIKSMNIWNSKFDIFKDGVDKGDIIFNWKGQIIIRRIDEQEVEQSFMLKSKGFWRSYFELVDEQGEILFELKPSMNWKKLNFSYEIKRMTTAYEEDFLTEMLVYSGFGANLFMTAMHASF
jgi:hypothetical protein